MIFHRLSLIALTFVTAVTAGPIATSYVVHEKRDGVPGGWTRGGKVNPHMSLPLRIALKQNNLHLGHDHLMDVSDPRSENYGQHWSATRVAEYFAPSEDSVDAVKQWLVSSGIDAGRLSRSFSLGWIELDASASEIESLLHTDLSVYLHENGQAHVACIEYSVPESIREHIDFITPTVHFDVKPNSGGKKQRDIARRSTSSTIAARESGKLVPHSMARLDKGHKNRSPNPDNFDPFGVAHCDLNITLSCLRALYEIPVSTRANPKNSFGITEYSNFYLPADMDMFFKLFEPDLVGHRPVLNSVDGGEDETQFVSFGDNGESDLDLQYAMSLVYPQEIQLFQNGDIVEGASFNNFLDAIDASYCTFEGGDDPTQDGVYPDPSNITGAFKGPQACGTYEPTWVISTSYGMNEVDATPFYLQRQCQEYMKLGLQGVTILYSSGDNGVAGEDNQGNTVCLDSATGQFINSTSGGRFVPDFPATCPYVTAVGATQVEPGASITQPEIACATVIFSGGGFSDVFPIPSYQESTVSEYFSHHLPPYTSAQYNNSQKARGFPDVSANGAWYVIAIDGEFEAVFGTSCSSPVWGSIITLINEERFNLGKSSVGFINPTLYQNPDALNDITKGTNPGCATEGFSAVPGWDPVTGLGTPNFPKLLDIFLSLK